MGAVGKYAAIVGALMVMSSLGPALAAHGAWGGQVGQVEPNTKWDTPTHMFPTANRQAVEKVYFNGVIIHEDFYEPYEVQIEGGSVLSPVSMRFAAILGFWRDCNEDGYIGARAAPASMGSFSVYPRAAFRINTAICPPGSPYNQVNAQTGQPNGYIDELRWIGPLTGAAPAAACIPPSQNPPTGLCFRAQPYEDPTDVSDTQVKVWVDWNYPGGRHIPHQGLTAQPPGTYDDSDGTLKYVDDALQRQVSSNAGDPWNTKPNVGGCHYPPRFGGGPPTVVRAGPVQRDLGGTCGYWPLYQVEHRIDDAEPAYRKNATPIVQVFDVENDSNGKDNPCDDFFRAPVVVPNPGGRDPVMDGVGLPQPDPKVNPNILVEGSIRGTATNIGRAINGTGGPEGKQCGSGSFGPESPESATLDAEFTHRLPTDILGYFPDQRYRTLAAQGFDYAPYDFTGLGVRSGPGAPAGNPAGWYGAFGWTGRPPRTGMGSLSNAYATFYADVSPQSVPAFPGQKTNNSLALASYSLPALRQDAHTYGVEFCSSFTEGPSNVNPANDWECSKTVWQEKRGSATYAIIGDPYDLRDVDCYDNTVSRFTAGVRVGIADCTKDH